MHDNEDFPNKQIKTKSSARRGGVGGWSASSEGEGRVGEGRGGEVRGEVTVPVVLVVGGVVGGGGRPRTPARNSWTRVVLS